MIKKSVSVPNLSSAGIAPKDAPATKEPAGKGIKEKFLSPLSNNKLVNKEPKGITSSRTVRYLFLNSLLF